MIASPIFGSFEDFPPMLIHASRSDILFDDSVRLADRVRKRRIPRRFAGDEREHRAGGGTGQVRADRLCIALLPAFGSLDDDEAARPEEPERVQRGDHILS